jgi:hypothetical protein
VVVGGLGLAVVVYSDVYVSGRGYFVQLQLLERREKGKSDVVNTRAETCSLIIMTVMN